ncbi:MAG: collagen-like triple helix repeat-containing protein [Candidatus Cyclobacteriaceae bacterium M2_1C_046]
MKNIKYLSGLGTIILILGLLACEGPAGSEGPQGTQGLQGELGPQGEEGNANVVADTLTLTNDDWIWNSTFYLQTTNSGANGYFTRYVDLNIPAITEDILYSGQINIYMENAPTFSSSWVSLPLEFTLTTYSIIYQFEIFEGLIRFHYFHVRNDPDATPPSTVDAVIPTRLYKWVVIEGNFAAKMEAAGIDMSNYDEVIEYFKSRSIPIKSGTVMQK